MLNRLQSTSLRSKLLTLSLFAWCGIAGIGGVAGYSIKALQTDLIRSSIGSQAIRNQMDADMMHDAIRADVLAALHSVNKADHKEILSATEKEFEEHSNKIRKTFAENHSLNLPDHIKQAITHIEPDLEQYVKQAAHIILLTSNSPQSAEQEFPIFMKSFSVLEIGMEKVDSLIENTVMSYERTSTDRVKQSFWLILSTSLSCITLLTLIALWVIRCVHNGLKEADDLLDLTVNGNLTTHFTHKQQHSKELSQLITKIHLTRNSLLHMIKKILETADALKNSSQQLDNSVDSLLNSSSAQHASANHVASAIEEILASIENVSERSSHSGETFKQSGLLCQDGINSMGNTINNMENIVSNVSGTSAQLGELAQSSKRISEVVNVIKEIAQQTGLLALNAAIEAARAGEQGRGFAVVADEVRKLADRTAISTVEITTMINEILSRITVSVEEMQTSMSYVEVGMEITHATNQIMQQISQGTHSAIMNVNEISHSLKEQSSATSSISDAVLGIVTQADAHYSLSQQVSESAKTLEQLATQLNTQANVFTIN